MPTPTDASPAPPVAPILFAGRTPLRAADAASYRATTSELDPKTFRAAE